MRRPVTASYLYAAISIVIGPAIVIASKAIYPMTVACGDEDMLDPAAQTLRNFINNAYGSSAFETLLAGLMIAVGVVLLRKLSKLPQADKKKNSTSIAIILISTMLIGYCLIILMAALLTACVGTGKYTY